MVLGGGWCSQAVGAGRGTLPARGSKGARPLSGVSKERVCILHFCKSLWSGCIGLKVLANESRNKVHFGYAECSGTCAERKSLPRCRGRALTGTGQSPASRESPQLREHSGEVIVGYNSGKPSFPPTTFLTVDAQDTLLSR